MKQTSRITSTYSADTMGVCSALFELGGMTIMHDASGCNSTYTTHDEPRWYDMDSMVYISGLSEMEAIMGDDEKILGDIEDAVRDFHPKFVAIAGTPIPTMTGFDFESVATLAEQRTGIPCFGFPTTGMNTYVHGASMAFKALAERFVQEPSEEDYIATKSEIDESYELPNSKGIKIRVNILGLTPLDFSVNGSDKSIASLLEGHGFEIVSRWAMGSAPEEIAMAGSADVNLVVSASGLAAADVLLERFGIPYIVGAPFGDAMRDIITEDLRNMAVVHSGKCGRRMLSISVGGIPDNFDFYAENEYLTVYSDFEEPAPDNIYDLIDEENPDFDNPTEIGNIVIIGEGVTSLSLASAIEFELGIYTKVLCATECPDGILRSKDRMAPDEDDIIPELEGATHIIADPLYKPICPPDAKFIPLPHEAFSGRLYRADIPNLINDISHFEKSLW